MRRTISEARAWLEDNAPALNPEAYRQVEQEVQEAEQQARAHGQAFASEQFDRLDLQRVELLREACEVRDAYEQLRDSGGLTLAAEEYRERLAALDHRRDRVERQLDEVERRVETLADVEDDPIAWADRRYEVSPRLRPYFSF